MGYLLLGGGSVMPEITIRGKPQQILQDLLVMNIIASTRSNEGWELFQVDEEWEYIPVWDIDLCPVCESYAGPWTGDQVPIEFHQWKRQHPLRTLMKNEVYPNTHESVGASFLYGTCRCVLEWADFFFTCLMRLHNELEMIASAKWGTP